MSNLRLVYGQFQMSEIMTYSLPDHSIQTTTIHPRYIHRERICQYSCLMIKLSLHIGLLDPALANLITPYHLHNISVGCTKEKKKDNKQYPMKIEELVGVCW